MHYREDAVAVEAVVPLAEAAAVAPEVVAVAAETAPGS